MAPDSEEDSCIALYIRCQRLQRDLQDAHRELQATRAQTCELIALARQVQADAAWRAAAPLPALHLPAIPDPDPHAAVLMALRIMRDILDDFPLEWQVAMVKALGARTMIVGQAHERAAEIPRVLSA